MSLPIYLFAVDDKISHGEINIPGVTSEVVMNNVLNLIYFTCGTVAVIVIILAGFKFATSVYEPAKITAAKNQILYAVVGLIVVIIAFFVTQFVMGKFG